MSSFFKSPIDIEILLDGEESRKQVELANSAGSGSKTLLDRFPVYEDGESVSGIATIRIREGKKLEHMGIKISLIGSIDMIKSSGQGTMTKPLEGRKKPVEQFIGLSYDLCPAGELASTQNFQFLFKDVSKQYESYRGKNVDISYHVKVTVLRKSADISKVKRFWVYLYKEPIEEKKTIVPTDNNDEDVRVTDDGKLIKPIKLDIGIENCLHIEFEYSKASYALNDVIVGRIYFLLTRLKIKHMELSIITRETSGIKPSTNIIDSTAIRYEIMDGSPVKGETIPIRLFLGGYELVPSMSCNYFSLKNYLSLVIIDEDGRRYFKQSEINFYRSK